MDVRAGYEDTSRVSLISSPVEWQGLAEWSHKLHDETYMMCFSCTDCNSFRCALQSLQDLGVP